MSSALMPPSMATLSRYGTARLLERDHDHGDDAERGAPAVRVGEAREPGELELARQVHEGAPALAAPRGWRRCRAGRCDGRRWPSGRAPRRPAGARPSPAATAVASASRRRRARSPRARRRRTCGRTGRRPAISSSCVPRSSMRPWSSTTTSSASEMVLGRWAMMKVVRPRITSLQRGADLELRLDVDAAGGVVEDEDARVHDERPRDRDALALAAAEREAALADDRLVALGERLDEVVGLRGPGRRAAPRPRSPPAARSGCSRRSRC